MGTLRGVIRGNTIELSEPTGLADGQEVIVAYSPVNAGTPEERAESLKRLFGAWADEEDDHDEFVAWYREQRGHPRREPEA